MEWMKNGSVVSAEGYRTGYARCGIKATAGEPDVALIASDRPAAAAGTFTTNRFAAAPVAWCRDVLPSPNIRAVVVNAGNANACTGQQGEDDVRSCAELAGKLLGCHSRQVLAASTGTIGRPLPMDKLTSGIREAGGALSADEATARGAEQAILTTDTRPKACAVRGTIGGKTFHVGGMAKGAGMIAPNMATMLCFVTTDAGVAPDLLDRLAREVVELTFNRISVDGDTSTNDSVMVLANGASGVVIDEEDASETEFRECLREVLQYLATEIVRDGEGATKLIRVEVTGAASSDEAETVARAVAESQLFKCAVYGGDPNWGRIACAAGYSGAPVEPQHTSIHIGETCVLEAGMPTGADASDAMAGEDIKVRVALGRGEARAQVLTCDLTEEYVRINAKYLG